MATLTDTAALVRKTVVYLIIGGIFIIILLISSPLIVSRFKKPEPPPVSKPESAFGKLPAILFPENKTYPSVFKLETIEGRPPESSATAKVYFIPKKAPTLFSRKNAFAFAQKFNFYEDGENISELIYKFTDQKENRVLTLDITNNNFHYEKTVSDSSFFQNAVYLEENNAISYARGFFSNLGVFDQSLDKIKVTYYIFDQNKLLIVKKPLESQAIRVDFLRSNIEKIPVITSDYDYSNTYIIFSPKDDGSQILKFTIKASFQNSPPNLANPSTYSIISASSAWDNLKNGKGYIVKPLNNGVDAVIRKIYMAYFQSDEYQPYLQPVFVFEGDNDFAGIVPAIDPFWVGS